MGFIILVALETLIIVMMIVIAVVIIVEIIAVIAIIQMRRLVLKLHYTNCIIYIVRIISCELHYADCIRLSAAFHELRNTNKSCNIAKEKT